ncbi:MAG: TIGR03790 family protein, partial [Bryobacteraceae bacterium]
MLLLPSLSVAVGVALIIALGCGNSKRPLQAMGHSETTADNEVIRIAPIFLALTFAGMAFSQGPENVLVVVNQPSGISRQIAAYYMKKRAIPPANLCTLRTTEDEHVSRAVFDKEIAKPLAACLTAKHLQEQILYIVLTKGVPLVIDGSMSMNGEYASVDSELVPLYADMKGDRHALAGPLNNPFFGKIDIPFTHSRFPIYLVTRLAGYDFADVKAMIDRGLLARNRGKFVIDLRSSEDASGNHWLRTAAVLLPKNRVNLDETDEVLYNQKEVIGFASWGSNDKNRHKRLVGFEWLPGGIMTE